MPKRSKTYGYLTQRREESMVRVIRPEYNRAKHGDIRLSDYVEVPRLSTFGTFPLMDMLSNTSIVNVINTYNALKGQEKKRLDKLRLPHSA